MLKRIIQASCLALAAFTLTGCPSEQCLECERPSGGANEYCDGDTCYTCDAFGRCDPIRCYTNADCPAWDMVCGADQLCRDASGDPLEGGSGGGQGECAVDAECPAGQACNDWGRCVWTGEDPVGGAGGEAPVGGTGGACDVEDPVPSLPARCVERADCEDPEEICVDGACVVPEDGVSPEPGASGQACDRSCDCPRGEICDPESSRCALPQADPEVPAERACENDCACPSGDVCIAGLCHSPSAGEVCAPEAPACGLGGACDAEAGVCVSAPAAAGEAGRCVMDLDCRPGHACLDGGCRLACVEDAGCATGTHCLEGLCVPWGDEGPVECQRSEACGGGVCLNAICHARCEGDDACGAGEMCDGGICVADTRPGPMCVRNVDCGGGLVCADGQCRAPCDGAGQCPGDDVCVDRVCVDPVEAAPECADSAGCVGALICRDARCVAWP